MRCNHEFENGRCKNCGRREAKCAYCGKYLEVLANPSNIIRFCSEPEDHRALYVQSGAYSRRMEALR